MFGVILAGGFGNRLKPLTQITNKHLLPVYDRPMILHPLSTLISCGLKDIVIIIGPEYAGGFFNLLGNGSQYNCNLYYLCQTEAKGIAHALYQAKDLIKGQNLAVILGDNIFEDNLEEDVQNFKEGAHIFLKEIDDARRFGVATIDANSKKVTKIVEKPQNPESNYAVTGFYLYDKKVFEYIEKLKPSNRGEYEISDVHNLYIKNNELTASILQKEWTDAGTFESLFHASTIARKKNQSNL